MATGVGRPCYNSRMIRTRDFLLFGMAVVALVSAIGVTAALDLTRTSQTAAVALFAEAPDPNGAEVVVEQDDKEKVAKRLREKIARGDGEVKGGPVFTSVDDITNNEEVTLTDDSPIVSTMIGHTTDGGALFSDGVWRFIGFGAEDQIGTAVNGTPIFGARADGLTLDRCGGGDDGSGYKLYLQTDREVDIKCFTD